MAQPSEPTTSLDGLTAWDIEILLMLIESPACAVYGHERRIKIERLNSRLKKARGGLVAAGAYAQAAPPSNNRHARRAQGKKR